MNISNWKVRVHVRLYGLMYSSSHASLVVLASSVLSVLISFLSCSHAPSLILQWYNPVRYALCTCVIGGVYPCYWRCVCVHEYGGSVRASEELHYYVVWMFTWWAMQLATGCLVSAIFSTFKCQSLYSHAHTHTHTCFWLLQCNKTTHLSEWVIPLN